MNKIERHEELCKEIHEIYKKKNAAYGDSFGDTYDRLGLISCLTRISDKYNRIINLGTNKNVDDLDESIKDTLIDLSNYCLMTVIELEKEQ